jgi:hypothetical protein
MSEFTASEQKTIPPTHQDFHWIEGPGQELQLADFVELTHDVTAGIHTCLQLIYSSDLNREINLDAESGEETPPAIGTSDATNLMRLSITAVNMLHQLSEQRIEWLNQYQAS